MIRVRPLPADAMVIEADEAERAALAQRFALPALARLRAEVTLASEGPAIHATGTLSADLTQTCAVSGEPFAVAIDVPVDLRFVRESTLPQSETEDGEIAVDLTAEDSDEIEYAGDSFDLGEAVAQTLGLAIDPYAEGPGAAAARAEAGLSDETTPSGPLAEALKGLTRG
jgi:uncharacterized metal-binding protein YceD (DUF177 family)